MFLLTFELKIKNKQIIKFQWKIRIMSKHTPTEIWLSYPHPPSLAFLYSVHMLFNTCALQQQINIPWKKKNNDQLKPFNTLATVMRQSICWWFCGCSEITASMFFLKCYYHWYYHYQDTVANQWRLKVCLHAVFKGAFILHVLYNSFSGGGGGGDLKSHSVSYLIVLTILHCYFILHRYNKAGALSLQFLSWS